ncbi:MAG: hypothetical protein A3H97_21930 [Acidobacteria bacterium RIFCSPLOWO2_02_FULL_65_29]|nr:MAG: hypothetical protein A3H97_21930 [Acidobacteria bacterium RIFCSPLOWO2_02_FULL_65_29]
MSSSAKPFSPAGSARALGYALLWHSADALARAANGCLYLAAGFLRQNELQAASALRWVNFGVSAAGDAEIGLTPSERRLYLEVLHPADRVLLVGCGTGRDLIGLCELGFEVTGIDQAAELVEIARQNLARRGLTASVALERAEDIELHDQYDAIVFSNGCYSFLRPSASRVGMLARMKSRLSNGGHVVIAYTAFARPSALSVRLTDISARLSGADWRPERGDCFSRDHLGRRVLRYEHAFRPDEVAAECAAAGLRGIRDDPGDPPLRFLVAVP